MIRTLYPILLGLWYNGRKGNIVTIYYKNSHIPNQIYKLC